MTTSLCGLSNRIELAANFASSTFDPQSTRNTLAEAISASINLLDQIDPFWLRIALTESIDRYQAKGHSVGTEFFGVHGDFMHSIGVHQKAIARIGTAVSMWDGESTTYARLGEALDTISLVVSQPISKLQQWMLPQKCRPLFTFSDIFYGLTIAVAALQSNESQADAIANASTSHCVDSAVMLSKAILTTDAA